MAIQNQGYAAYIALVDGIKQLREFNSDLHLSLIQKMTCNQQ